MNALKKQQLEKNLDHWLRAQAEEFEFFELFPFLSLMVPKMEGFFDIPLYSAPEKCGEVLVRLDF